MSGEDVGKGSSTEFVVIYLGGTGGSTSGIDYYKAFKPTLPFPALWAIHWKTNNDSTVIHKWSGSNWDIQTFDWTGLVYQKDNYVEIALPLAQLGSPTTINFAMAMLNQSGDGWTFAGVPSTSFVDGNTPNFGKYFTFDLQGSTVPSAHPVKP